MTVLATSLLSLMALQGFVSVALPPTETITYIHYALYTAYALMGWGIGLVITVSFFLSADLDAAKKIRPDAEAPPLEGKSAIEPHLMKTSTFNHRHLSHNIIRVPKLSAEGEVRIKPWVMRLYYRDALVYRRMRMGRETAEDRERHLVYFPRPGAADGTTRRGRMSTKDVEVPAEAAAPAEGAVEGEGAHEHYLPTSAFPAAAAGTAPADPPLSQCCGCASS